MIQRYIVQKQFQLFETKNQKNCHEHEKELDLLVSG